MGTAYSTNQVLSDEDPDPDYLPSAREPMDYTTDAVESLLVRPEPVVQQQLNPRITETKIAEIETELDLYEKVSLVYLLFDDAEIALQYTIQIEEGAQKNVLVEWAQFAAKNSSNWQDKLLEALCIIQNYKVIRLLGYTKTEVYERFLPLNSNMSLFIDSAKKKLYRMCDNLDDNDTREFLKIIRRDFQEKKLHFKNFDENFLEMYLLYWTTIKYITSTDVTNLCKSLKMLEKYDMAESLKSITRDVTPTVTLSETGADNSTSNNELSRPSTSRNTVFDDVLALERSLSVGSSGAGSLIQQDRIRKNSYEGRRYNVDENAPGICLIINQEDFYTEPDQNLKHLLPPTNKLLEKREGTKIDRDKLQETFTKFRFTVIIEDNLIHSEMKNKIEETVKMIRNDSSLIICILSHGIKGKVYGVNSIPVEVQDIRNIMCKFNQKNLKGKPKILILQSCQGSECQKVENDDDDDESDEREDLNDNLETDSPTVAIPRTADMLVFWATVPGYSAVRDRKRGTWFIQSLCEKISRYAAEMHFEDICTMVKKEVIHEKKWKTSKSTQVMVPIKESTLSGFFYLPAAREES